jgi:hypothetical protein
VRDDAGAEAVDGGGGVDLDVGKRLVALGLGQLLRSEGHAVPLALGVVDVEDDAGLDELGPHDGRAARGVSGEDGREAVELADHEDGRQEAAGVAVDVELADADAVDGHVKRDGSDPAGAEHAVEDEVGVLDRDERVRGAVDVDCDVGPPDERVGQAEQPLPGVAREGGREVLDGAQVADVAQEGHVLDQAARRALGGLDRADDAPVGRVELARLGRLALAVDGGVDAAHVGPEADNVARDEVLHDARLGGRPAGLGAPVARAKGVAEAVGDLGVLEDVGGRHVLAVVDLAVDLLDEDLDRLAHQLAEQEAHEHAGRVDPLGGARVAVVGRPLARQDGGRLADHAAEEEALHGEDLGRGVDADVREDLVRDNVLHVAEPRLGRLVLAAPAGHDGHDLVGVEPVERVFNDRDRHGAGGRRDDAPAVALGAERAVEHVVQRVAAEQHEHVRNGDLQRDERERNGDDWHARGALLGAVYVEGGRRAGLGLVARPDLAHARGLVGRLAGEDVVGVGLELFLAEDALLVAVEDKVPAGVHHALAVVAQPVGRRAEDGADHGGYVAQAERPPHLDRVPPAQLAVRQDRVDGVLDVDAHRAGVVEAPQLGLGVRDAADRPRVLSHGRQLDRRADDADAVLDGGVAPAGDDFRVLLEDEGQHLGHEAVVALNHGRHEAGVFDRAVDQGVLDVLRQELLGLVGLGGLVGLVGLGGLVGLAGGGRRRRDGRPAGGRRRRDGRPAGGRRELAPF